MFPSSQLSRSLLKCQRAVSVALINSEIRNVLLLQRPKEHELLPGAMVFPGGKFEITVDSEFPRKKTNWNLVEEQPLRPMELAEDYVFRVAALRELFIQTGTLLLYSVNCRESSIVTSKDDKALIEWKDKVKNEPTKFEELFNKTDKLDVNLLIPWSNWLTPMGSLNRLDKLFFLAPFDNLNETFWDLEEGNMFFGHPSDIIEKNATSGLSVPIPQFYELLRIRLSHHDHLHSQISARLVLPQLIHTEDQKLGAFLFPEDQLYLSDESEFVSARTLKESEIVPNKEIDQLRTIHRIVFQKGFVENELFLQNVPKMPFKPHLFHCNGNIYNDFP
ncbi:unnamed protein product [Bursaphelenchus xylophilus]|uniref:(pine wood nematode) hypothetical protein n=1 Tax=Bursaphelenchus xylophilus TaxID=6326 RepID=A0A1I7RWB1_BURXY|nr:unnamed protein product [Bursaphelenchus xylophilus]CAG9095393.1 unnamed protein product [Bursaphelenchus xylophilus]